MKIPAHLAFLAPLLLTLAVFWQVTQFNFVNYDDSGYVYKNPHISAGLTRESMQWAFCADLCFDSYHADYWQPVTVLSRMMDVQIWRLKPFGHHLTNLLLHLANVLLLYFIFLILSQGNFWLAAWIAAAFGIHPVQAEIVPWVTARKDVLNIFFGFLTLLAYLRYTQKISLPRYLMILPLYMLSLMSKPMLFTMPLLLLILDYWPLERWKNSAVDIKRIWLRLVLEKLPLFFLSGAIIYLIRFTNSKISDVPFYYREVPVTLLKYVRDIISPVAFVEHIVKSRPIWQPCAAGIILVILTYFLFRTGRRYPFLRAGWLWFLTGLIPVVLLWHEIRFLYVSIIGLLFTLAWGYIKVCRHWNIPMKIRIIIAVLPLILWAMTSFVHAQRWRNSLDLSLHIVSARPDEALTHRTLAFTLWESKDEDAIIRQMTRAAKFKPKSDGIHADLVKLLHQGKNKVAAAHFERALVLKPDSADTHNGYGVFLEIAGNREEAIKHYKKALEFAPQQAAGARMNLSQAFWAMGKKAEAIDEFEKAMALFAHEDESLAPLEKVNTAPAVDYKVSAFAHFGRKLAESGSYQEAGEYFKKAIELNPNDSEAYNNLGITLTYLNRHAEAPFYFEEAIEINPQYAQAYNNLANVWMQEEKWDAAENYFKKALEVDPNFEMARRNLQKLVARKIAAGANG